MSNEQRRKATEVNTKDSQTRTCVKQFGNKRKPKLGATCSDPTNIYVYMYVCYLDGGTRAKLTSVIRDGIYLAEGICH